MISSVLFTLSAFCVVAMFIPQRPRQALQQVETYYVCDPDSYPNRPTDSDSPALVGELCA